VIRLENRIGSFVSAGRPLAVAAPYGHVSDKVAKDLVMLFVLGLERTPEFDIEFGLRRIVEIAQRALSPGINDPTTALYCLDRLEEVLEALSVRTMPPGRMCDEDGTVRVVFEPASFAELACSAFAAVARYGVEDDDIVLHLLCVMERCCRGARSTDRDTIMQLHDAIKRDSHLPRFGISRERVRKADA
jgi:uncharacterized membrane protein